jgi:hypothetical protein
MKLWKHSEQGSVFIVVIAAVAIATIIAVTFLSFMNDARERVGREMDQAKQQVSLEGTLLTMKKAIAKQAADNGSIDLSGMQRNGFTLTWVPSNDNSSRQLAPLSGPSGVGDTADPLQPLDGNDEGDPFRGASAQILKINVDGSAETPRLPRLSNKVVTVTPTIDVRQIPVSQFTAFSENSSVNIDSTSFGGNAGRVFGQEGITVTGSLGTRYPLVSGKGFSGAGSIQFNVAPGQSISFSPNNEPTTDPGDLQFLGDARTSLDSFVITPVVLPLDVVLVPDKNSEQTGGWDLQASVNQADIKFEITGDGKGNYSVRATGPDSQWFRPVDPKSVAGDQSKKPQSCPCLAKDGDGDLKNQIVIGFNYETVPDTVKRIAFVVSNARPESVTLLIRGASMLKGPVSIVTPHNVIFEGNFNSLGADPPPASVMTSQAVSSAPLGRGDKYFGFVQ